MASASIELEHAIGFSAQVSQGLQLHPTDGKSYVAVSGAAIIICDLTDPHNQSFLRGHDDDITCVAISNDGGLVASGQCGQNADVVVWDWVTRLEKFRLSEHRHGIACVAFSDDGRFLVTVGVAQDRRIFVWDLTNGYIVGQSFAQPQPTRQVRWGGRVRDIKRRPTADYLLATCGGNEVRLWSLSPATGQLTSEKCASGQHTRDYTAALAFSPDGEWVYAGSKSGDVSVFQVRNKIFKRAFNAGSAGVTCVCVSQVDDRYICAAGGGDGSAVVLLADVDTCDYRQSARVQLSGAVTSLSRSVDGREYLAATSTGNVCRLRASDLNSVLLSEHHGGAVSGVCFANGVSERFATCCPGDGSVRVWDANDYRVLAQCRLPGATTQPTALAISEDCALIGWSDGRLRSFSVADGTLLWSIDNAHHGSVTALVLSANQKFCVSGGSDGEVRVWELRSRALVARMKEHTSAVTGLALFDDNRHALSCSRDRSFICWDLQAEKRVSAHRQNMGALNDIVLSKDQSLVLTVGSEKAVTVWDLRLPQPVSSIANAHGQHHEALCITFSNTGKYFVTGGSDHSIKLWDFASKQLISSGVGHSNAVRSVRFSADDKQIVSTGDDGNVLVWNVFEM